MITKEQIEKMLRAWRNQHDDKVVIFADDLVDAMEAYIDQLENYDYEDLFVKNLSDDYREVLSYIHGALQYEQYLALSKYISELCKIAAVRGAKIEQLENAIIDSFHSNALHGHIIDDEIQLHLLRKYQAKLQNQPLSND